MASLNSRLLVPAITICLPMLGCYEPSILGVLEPDAACEYSTGGVIRGRGILDVGPSEALAHPYALALLVGGRADDEVTATSVAFADADGEPLADTSYNGHDVVFPSVEGEREADLSLTLNGDGRAVVPLTLVTQDEAAALQNFTSVGEDLDLRMEVKVYFGSISTVPFFVPLTICQQCLVGVGAELEGDELVCSDDSAPTVVDDEPCYVGQDYIHSSCE